MALLLQRVGHEASTANDGHEALEIAERTRPDVVLLDPMPDIDGYEVARRMRSRPWGRASC
jgi:CheY-like chemotaxis protein